jgi:CheY-like chemotaxis protein
VNIGVLDDNPAILAFLSTTLKMDGHQVVEHTTGTSMLDAIFSSASSPQEAQPYDLVVLDLLLPGTMTGADVFFAIRKEFESWQLPVIVITAVSGPTLEQFRYILPDDVPLLRKPFAPRTLRQLIANLTEQ